MRTEDGSRLGQIADDFLTVCGEVDVVEDEFEDQNEDWGCCLLLLDSV